MIAQINTIDLDRRQSLVIDAMRFPLIVLVVTIHVLPFDLKPIDLSFSYEAAYTFITEMLSHNIGRIAVPSFFLFSGYYFFRNMEQWDAIFYGNQIKKRISSLLIPFLIWNSFTVVVSIFVGELYEYFNIESSTNHNPLLAYSLYEIYWGMPINFPLWYIRDLMCMTLITPLFFHFFSYLKGWGVIALIYYYLFGFGFELSGFSSTAIFYYGLGAYLGIYKINVLAITRQIKLISIWVSLLLLLIATFLNGQGYIYELFIRLFIPFAILSSISFIDFLADNQRFMKSVITLRPTVFFVYAIHSIYIIGYIKGFFSKVNFFTSGIGLFFAYFLIPIITITICLAIFYLWKKISPKTLSIFVGGRVS